LEEVLDQYWTVQDVSTYLKIKANTIYAWAAGGIIPRYKFGRNVRFKREDIESWASSQRQDKAGEKLSYPTTGSPEDIIEFAKNSVLSSKEGKARPASEKGGESK
jgi:excisionase family DNA binding protein